MDFYLQEANIMTIYLERRKKFTTYLQQNDYSYAMISNPANVFYLSGFYTDPHERFLAIIFDVKNGKEYFFVPALDKEAAARDSDLKTIIPISDNELPLDVVQNTIGNLGGSFGIEGKQLSYLQYIEFKQQFPSLEFNDVQPFVNQLRVNKSQEEIVALKKALDIIEKVLEEGIKSIKIGMTEIEIVANLEYLMRKFGADGPSFSTIVLTGKNAALPHGIPGETKIADGDLLLIDFGVVKDGYCSDITRTFAINSMSERQRELYNIVLTANEAGIAAVKAGVPLNTFDIAARDVIEEAGYGEYYNNRVGHGLGIEIHEEPSVHGNNETIATNGLVFTIEPGIYIPNELGIRIEDTVFINGEGKVEILSSFPKQLQII